MTEVGYDDLRERKRRLDSKCTTDVQDQIDEADGEALGMEYCMFANPSLGNWCWCTAARKATNVHNESHKNYGSTERSFKP